MTGPDATIIWITLGCIAVLAILGALIVVAASLADGADGDAARDDTGADWSAEGSFQLHNETGK
jgi:hypothetical protein